jgi:2-polyprenyl-3-methyl-5-hydroxy-6-metoxy-1,4-benzoquinol methylase
MLKKPLKKCTVLQIVSGYGVFANSLAPHVKNLKGIDVNQSRVEIAKKNAEKINLRNIEYYVKSIFDFLNNNRYDIVILMDVLEHIKEQKAVLEKCLNLLDDKGVLFINTPNKWFPIEAHTGNLFLGWFPPKFAENYARVILKKRYKNIYLIGFFKFLLLLNSFSVDYNFKAFSDPSRILYRIGNKFIRISSFFWCFSNAFQVVIKKRENS